MSAFLLTVSLLWAQVNPVNPAPAPPAAAAPNAAQAAANPAAAAPNAAQAAANPAAALPALPPITPEVMNVLAWLYLFGDPPQTHRNVLLAGFLAWLKVISLLCLVGWSFSWLVVGIKERVVGRGAWHDYLAVAVLVAGLVTVLLRVLESVHRIPVYFIGPVPVTSLTLMACAV